MIRNVQVLKWLLSAAVFLPLMSGGTRPVVAQGAKKVETKEVPLESIYYTFPQKGLKALNKRDVDEKYHLVMQEIYNTAVRMGASSVFLARGDNTSEAVKGAWWVFRMNNSAEEPSPLHSSSKSDQFWLVAYLGSAGSHGEWLLKSARIGEETIRLVYCQVKGGAVRDDRHPYIAWVPLGKLEPGSYALELFDADEKQVTLRRRVAIPQRKK